MKMQRKREINPRNQQFVVLFHGILKNSDHLISIWEALKRRGYNVLNINYSYKNSISEIADYAYDQIRDHILVQGGSQPQKINFVGHSMGGLVIRVLLNNNQFHNLGRVVQIGTPNNGSEITDLLKNNYLYKKCCGSAGQELASNNVELQNQMGEINYRLGVIAGDASSIIHNLIFRGRNDRRVSVDSTRVCGMADHIVVNESHNKLVTNKKVIEQVINFIEHGKFLKLKKPKREIK